MKQESQNTCCSSASACCDPKTEQSPSPERNCCGSEAEQSLSLEHSCCGSEVEQSPSSEHSCCGSEVEQSPSSERNFCDLEAEEDPSSEHSCCGSKAEQIPLPEWSMGKTQTIAGDVLKVPTEWTRNDRWGQFKARISSFRNDYTVEPGLYAFGDADETSDVFVSANYKLSFDILRRALHGRNGWILVLDTKGINVWCAAGKGTFGTYELVNRVLDTQLKKVVTHRTLILPQLGAPGVNSIEVQKRTGFKVLFGPVDANDIPAYIQDGYSALPGMRTIRFPLKERLVLTPMEIRPMLKHFPLYALIVLAVFGLQTNGILFADAWNGGLPFLLQGLLSILAGAFIVPALLPFIPFRSFAIKGWIVGTIIVALSQFLELCRLPAGLLLLFGYLFFPLLSSYIALQFTGATTFTNISGVKKELRFGLPIYLIGGTISIFLLILYKVDEWGIQL